MTATQKSPLNPSGRLRILLVDDSRDACTVMGMLLETYGYEVRVAHTGDAALAVADEYRPQVVLLDIGLPDLDGYEVCRRLRSREAVASATIIALSGHGEPEDRTESRAAGFDHHVLKPANIGELQRLFPQPDN